VVLARLIRDLITSSGISSGFQQAEVIGRIAQISILVAAAVLGFSQIGIDISFLTIIIGVLLAAILGGIALAFAIGARSHAANVLGSHLARQLYHPGEMVRIAEFEGEILEIRSTVVLLETEEGRVAIPTRMFADQASILRAGTHRNESE